MKSAVLVLVGMCFVSHASLANAKASHTPDPRPAPTATTSKPGSATSTKKKWLTLAESPARAKWLESELAKTLAKPEGPDRSIEESRIYYFQALLYDDREKRKELFEKGTKAALDAKKSDSFNPAAIAWWAANQANYADALRSISSLRILSKVEDALIELKKIDPDFEGAAAARGLARLYHKAPSFLSVGSMSKAEMYFKQAMEKFPNHPGNQAYYAQFLLETGHCLNARELAYKSFTNPENAKYPYDAPHWREIASEILDATEAKCHTELARP